MKTKKVVAVFVAILMSLSVSTVSFAQTEVDSLVSMLVDKGVISNGEAAQLISEAQQAVTIQQIGAIENGPSWLAKTTFKGDLRIRHQFENKELSSSSPKHRLRTRFRWGFTNEMNSKLTVGARFATGTNVASDAAAYTTDSRSTNQTWQEGFGNWEFNIDEAYFDWHPYEWVSLIGGKREVKKIMFRTSDLLWDGDLTFDGGTLMLESPEVVDGLTFFGNFGLYVMDQEVIDNDDRNHNPLLINIQPGFEYNTKMDGSTFKTKVGFAYLGARNVDSSPKIDAKGSQATNTVETGTTLYRYGYDVFNPNIEIKYTWGGEKGKTYAAKVYGDYVYNPDPQDAGYLLGFKVGYDKTGKKFGDWQAFYNYRYLEDDAFLDIFPDSDAYGGKTNAKGSEIGLSIGLAKNVTLGFDYYYMEPISGSTRNTENLFQTDLLFKF